MRWVKGAEVRRYPGKTLPNIRIGIEGRGAVASPRADIFLLRDHLRTRPIRGWGVAGPTEPSVLGAGGFLGGAGGILPAHLHR
jgi:hypothetical protein